jgi:2'-hydroxyisoflavone reductase
MRLLVLGGTAFLGRAVARHAVAAGHEVTCAARGTSGRPADGAAFVEVDREDSGGLAPLAGSRFDALVDVSSRPSHVRRAVAAFAGMVAHATYVSTGSVYADDATAGQRVEGSPLVDPAPPDVDDPSADDYAAYGPCKRACEDAVLDGFGAGAFICRPGLIVGPEDRSHRFGYWVDRLARGGEVLAPGAPDDPVQYVDVRDLAAWIVDAAEAGLAGVYDGIGAPVGREHVLTHAAAAVAPAGTTLTWVDQDFLQAQGVRPWMGERSLPLWLPLPDFAGFMTRDVSASLAAGLHTREVAETARDTLAWLRTMPEADRTTAPGRTAGLTADDEAALLAAWHGSDS